MPRAKRKSSLSSTYDTKNKISVLKKELKIINKILGFGSSRLRFGNEDEDEENEMRAKLYSTGQVELNQLENLDREELQELTQGLILSLREQPTAEQVIQEIDANEILTSQRSIVRGLTLDNLLSLDIEEFDLLYLAHSINMNGDIENPYFNSINYTPLFREYTKDNRIEILNQFVTYRGIWERRTPAPWVYLGEVEIKNNEPPSQTNNQDVYLLLNRLRIMQELINEKITIRNGIQQNLINLRRDFRKNNQTFERMERSQNIEITRLTAELNQQRIQISILEDDIVKIETEIEMIRNEIEALNISISYVTPSQGTQEEIVKRLTDNGIGREITDGFNLEDLKQMELSLIETRGCTNLIDWDGQTVDPFSLESPDINNDRITIVGTDVGLGGKTEEDDDSSMLVVCFDRQFFINSLQTMARWVQIPGSEQPMTDMGIGGMADDNVLYFGPLSIINGISGYLNQDSFNLINNMVPGQNPIFRLEKIINEERIGNLDNIIGVGNHHGQIPGFPIYRLVRMT